jgi:dihydroorotase
MSCLAHTFEIAGALDKLETFTSLNGPLHYGLPVNDATITLTKRDTPAGYPKKLSTGEGPVTLFDPGFPLHWHIEA